jgi:hypothetical protein
VSAGVQIGLCRSSDGTPIVASSKDGALGRDAWRASNASAPIKLAPIKALMSSLHFSHEWVPRDVGIRRSLPTGRQERASARPRGESGNRCRWATSPLTASRNLCYLRLIDTYSLLPLGIKLGFSLKDIRNSL